MKSNTPNKTRPTTRRWLIGAGFVLLLAAALAAGNPAFVRDRLVAAKLWPQPEAFTELYFTQQLLLPKTAANGPVSFSFTVHNEQNGATTYPYLIVLAKPNGQAETLQTGSLTLQKGEARNVVVTAALPAGTTTAEIAVVLPNRQESIHFWLGAQS